MSALLQPDRVRLEPAQRFVLGCVSWEEYGKFLEAIGENHVRVTYDRGNLELMSPQPVHEVYKTLFGRLFDILMDELDIPMKALGSTTFRRQEAEARTRTGPVLLLRQRRAGPRAGGITTSPSILLPIWPSKWRTPPVVWTACMFTPACASRKYGALTDDGSSSIACGATAAIGWRREASNCLSCRWTRYRRCFSVAWKSRRTGRVLRGLREWVRTRVAPLRQASADRPKRRRRSDG